IPAGTLFPASSENCATAAPISGRRYTPSTSRTGFGSGSAVAATRGRRTLPSGWISASWRGSSGSSDDDARETNGPVQARCVPDPSPRRVGPLRRAGPLVPVRVALRQAPSEEPLLITALSLVA